MFVPKTIERLFGRIVRSIAGVDEKKLYGLDHAILNIKVPPRCMWMNMGYWKVCKTCQISASLAATLVSENGLTEKKEYVGHGLFLQGVRVPARSGFDHGGASSGYYYYYY